MIQVAFSSSFKRAFGKRIKGRGALEDRYWERLDVLIHDPFDPRLRTHKLSGALKEMWSFSVGHDLRVLFYFVGGQKVVLVDIGTHEEVY